MERRLNQRIATSVDVMTQEGSRKAECTGVDISVTGILVEHGRELTSHDNLGFIELDIDLPGTTPVHVLARPVRSFGKLQALKFIHMSDIDRLTLAEHIDASVRTTVH